MILKGVETIKYCIADKNVFFGEMTLRICSSLDNKIVLERAFSYLRRHIPLNHLTLIIPESSPGVAQVIAEVGDDGIHYPSTTIQVPKELGLSGFKFIKPFILSSPSPDPVIRILFNFAAREGTSTVLVPLQVENEKVGLLVACAIGKDCYTEEHLELLELVAKPFTISLANTWEYKAVQKARDQAINDNIFLQKELSASLGSEIIGATTGLRNVMEMVAQVAPQRTTVLLNGETGTGKEVIASAIHFTSPRKDGPFIKINCGAISENLIDAELFGHERGAFTGAITEKRGRFERANGGTLFLDEIGELPLQSQVRLLRVLQSRMISRVGGEKPIPVDVRIIAATNRDLKKMLAEGRFREDLWFRLNVFPITSPPLRQRKEDIPALVRHFVALKSREMGNSMPPPIAPDAFERLMNYNWPGNVRELENLVERELIRHRGGNLRFDCLALEEKCREETEASERAETLYPINFDAALRVHIARALEMTNGKLHGQGGAAELLGIHPNTLTSRMQKLGMACGRRTASAHQHIQES